MDETKTEPQEAPKINDITPVYHTPYEEELSLPRENETVALAVYLLLAGAALEVGGIAHRWLLGEEWEGADSRTVQSIIGFGYDAVQTAELVTRKTVGVAQRGWELSRFLLPTSMSQRIEQRMSRWLFIGRREGTAAQAQAQEVASLVVDGIVELVAASPAVNELVRQQVEAALPNLYENERLDEVVNNQVTRLTAEPKVRSLVRKQASQYLDYLAENPERVERLVHGQSAGLANEVLDEVREQTVTADAIVERIVRSVFRRRSRPSTAPVLPSNNGSGA